MTRVRNVHTVTTQMGERLVGVLGLGLIGSIWARHLHADGILGGAWNRTPKPDFPAWCPHPRVVLDRCEVVILCLADPQAVWTVIDSAFPALGEHHLIIQTSTIDPGSAARFEHVTHAGGARYVEAPFTGSQPGAESRKTVFYLGGNDASIEEAEPVLRHLSHKHFRIGTVSQAAALKLAFNLQIAAQAQALCESLRLCRDLGISDNTFFECLRPNAAWSGVIALKEPKLRTRDYSPQFSIKHLEKDIRLALEAGEEDELPVTRVLAARLQEALARGLGEDDFAALYQLYD